MREKLSLIVLVIVCFLMSVTTTYGSIKNYNVIHQQASWISEQTGAKYQFVFDITKYVWQNCERPELILSIIIEESNFDPKAMRKDTKVYGLGQIKFSVWKYDLKKLGITEPKHLFNPHKSVIAMDYIVNEYHQQSGGNINKTLKKYVGGCKKYAAKVTKNMKELKKIRGGKIVKS